MSHFSAIIRSLGLFISLGLVLAVSTGLLWPEASPLWRKGAALVLSVSLGFQITIAIAASKQGRAALKAWLECGAFPLVMSAFNFIPSVQGWLLLISGWAWHLLVRNLWK